MCVWGGSFWGKLTTDPDEDDLEEEVLAAFELFIPPLLLFPEDMGLGIPLGGGGPCICEVEE